MNNFELFKLKKAGLTNLNILAILDYQEKQEKSLSLRNMAVVSKCKNPILFMEKYKALDIKELRKEFNCFPSVSILDDCLLYTSPSPRDRTRSRMPSSA